MPLIIHHDLQPQPVSPQPLYRITHTTSRTPRWALTGPANTPYPLIGSIKKCVDRVHNSGLGDPFSDLILGDAIWAQSIVAYRELQKTQYYDTTKKSLCLYLPQYRPVKIKQSLHPSLRSIVRADLNQPDTGQRTRGLDGLAG